MGQKMDYISIWGDDHQSMTRDLHRQNIFEFFMEWEGWPYHINLIVNVRYPIAFPLNPAIILYFFTILFHYIPFMGYIPHGSSWYPVVYLHIIHDPMKPLDIHCSLGTRRSGTWPVALRWHLGELRWPCELLPYVFVQSISTFFISYYNP